MKEGLPGFPDRSPVTLTRRNLRYASISSAPRERFPGIRMLLFQESLGEDRCCVE